MSYLGDGAEESQWKSGNLRYKKVKNMNVAMLAMLGYGFGFGCIIGFVVAYYAVLRLKVGQL